MLDRVYRVDPADPRAPGEAQWRAMSPEQQAEVVASLPSEFQWPHPPEGDLHWQAKADALDALKRFFRGRNLYLSAELPVYYPREKVFAPDILAVRDVELHPRSSWIVSAEGRGLDFVLEIHVHGDRREDNIANVERCAALGIPEYFAYDPRRATLAGWWLASSEATTYSPIVRQGGQWASSVLDLDLALVDAVLRFYCSGARLPQADELIERLSSMVDHSIERASREAERVSLESMRADRAEQKMIKSEEKLRRLAERLRELGVDPDTLE